MLSLVQWHNLPVQWLASLVSFLLAYWARVPAFGQKSQNSMWSKICTIWCCILQHGPRGTVFFLSLRPYVELVNILLACGEEVKEAISRSVRIQCEQNWGALCHSLSFCSSPPPLANQERHASQHEHPKGPRQADKEKPSKVGSSAHPRSRGQGARRASLDATMAEQEDPENTDIRRWRTPKHRLSNRPSEALLLSFFPPAVIPDLPDCLLLQGICDVAHFWYCRSKVLLFLSHDSNITFLFRKHTPCKLFILFFMQCLNIKCTYKYISIITQTCINIAIVCSTDIL